MEDATGILAVAKQQRIIRLDPFLRIQVVKEKILEGILGDNGFNMDDYILFFPFSSEVKSQKGRFGVWMENEKTLVHYYNLYSGAINVRFLHSWIYSYFEKDTIELRRQQRIQTVKCTDGVIKKLIINELDTADKVLRNVAEKVGINKPELFKLKLIYSNGSGS